jgi:hypothetical protein
MSFKKISAGKLFLIGVGILLVKQFLIVPILVRNSPLLTIQVGAIMEISSWGIFILAFLQYLRDRRLTIKKKGNVIGDEN